MPAALGSTAARSRDSHGTRGMVRTGKLSAFALALAVICATSAQTPAHAQTWAQTPAHAQYAAEPETAEADDVEEMPDGEPMSDEPLDLTTPLSPSPRSFDASKFLQGLPSP